MKENRLKEVNNYIYLHLNLSLWLFMVREIKKTVKVKGHSYWKNGNKITVKGHKRKVTKKVTTVTKEQYKKKAAQRPKASLKRDRSRTKKKAIAGRKTVLPANWNTKNYDWIGVDARGYPKIPKANARLKGGYPGYTIVKFKTLRGKSRYMCLYKGNKIGPTTPYNNLQAAKKLCKVHHGRRTGKIRNARQADVLHKQTHTVKNPYRKIHDPHYDDAYDDSDAWYDSDITRSENISEGKRRHTLSSMHHLW